jgi:hypothetical protein
VESVVCISGDIVIARPPEVVFDVLADERTSRLSTRAWCAPRR